MTEELKEKAKEEAASSFVRLIGYEDRVTVRRISEAVRYGFDKGALFTNKVNESEKQLTEAKAIIKIAREAYIKSGIYTLNSEPVYKEEVERLYALFFDRAEAFLKEA